MPSTGNVGFEMTPMPLPAQSPTPVETYADTQKQQGPQMPSVYYGGKGGSTAFVADKILTGWLAGRKIANERQAKQMSDEVGAAKTGLDYIGQAYRAAVESGDEKKIAETNSALSEAYKDYLDKAEKYAIPEQQMGKDGKPKKQGVGSKIKQGMMGGPSPHLNIAHSTLDIMRKTDPTQLYGPSKREQQESAVLDAQTKQIKEQQEQHDRWTKIANTDPSQLKPEDKRFMEFYEYEHFGKSKADQTKDDLLGKALAGKLTDQERQVAEQLGIVKPKVVSTSTRTIMGPKGQPQTQLVSIGPDGSVVGTQTLPGNEYVPPNQAQMAGQVINAQMGAMMKWGEKAHPEWDQKTPEGKKMLTQWALSAVVGGAQGATADWYTKNNQMDVMNRALGAVIQKHTKEYKDPTTGAPQTERDDLASAILGNIVSTTDDGRYAYMPSLAAGQKEGGSTWYKPWTWGSDGTEKWSGMTREQLNDSERRFQAELRAELKKQNPKLSDTEIDKMVPQILTSAKGGTQAMSEPPAQGGAPQMAPPPSTFSGSKSGAADAALKAKDPGPPQPGEKKYSIIMPDGTTAYRNMSPDYADALAARGVKVQPVGQ